MSWAFILQMSLVLPTADYARIAATRAGDHELPSPLLGFDDAELEVVFTRDRSTSDDAAPTIVLGELAGYFEAQSGRLTVTDDGDTTTLRGLMALDRGADPWLAKPVAALLHAARASGTGHLLLFNDGTYSGEDGVVLELAGGAITRSKVSDCNALVEAIIPALEGEELPPTDELLALAKSGG